MSVIEFIGFIVSMLAMGFLYLKRMKEERYRREHPEDFADELHHEEEYEETRGFLKPANKHPHVERKPLPSRAALPRHMEAKRVEAHKGPNDKLVFQTSMAGYRQAAEKENRSLQSETDKRQTSSRNPFVSRNLDYTEGKYEVEYLRQDSRASTLIRQQHSLKDMFILKEILGPPKSMQKSWADPLAFFDEHQ